MNCIHFAAFSTNYKYSQLDTNVSLLFFILQARLFDEPQLASLCLDTIDKSTADAINAEGFTDIDLGM